MTNATHHATSDPTYGTDIAVPEEGLPSYPQPDADDVDQAAAAWEAEHAAEPRSIAPDPYTRTAVYLGERRDV